MRSIEDLIPDLIAATDGGRLSWQRAANFPPDSFHAPLGRHSILTYSWTSPDEEHEGYTVSIYEGTALSPLRPQVVDTVAADEFSAKFSLVQSMYVAARRSALKVDEVVDELENVLRSLPEPK